MIIFRTQNALNASANNVARPTPPKLHIRAATENLPIAKKIFSIQYFRQFTSTYLVILIKIVNPRDERFVCYIFHRFASVLSH